MNVPHADPKSPKITDAGDLTQLPKYYPAAALQQGIEAIVKVSLTLDPQGIVTEASAVEEYPEDKQWGFGPAACAVARTMRWSNPDGCAQQVELRVRFDLGRGTLPAQLPGLVNVARPTT